jgi:hypothetical protein
LLLLAEVVEAVALAVEAVEAALAGFVVHIPRLVAVAL